MWQWAKSARSQNPGDVAKTIINSAALPEVLEHGPFFKRSKRYTYYCCIIISFLIVWFSIARIQELVIAQGEVIPISQIKNISHLEGGLVKSVHVAEGDIVKEGDVLVTLSASGSGQDLKQLQVRRAHLALNKIRLAALMKDQDPDFSKWQRSHPKLVNDVRALYLNARNKLKKELLILESRLLQSRSEIEASELEYQTNQKHVSLLREKVAHKQTLFKKQLTTRDDFLEAQTDLQVAKARKIASQGKLAKAKLMFKEAEIKLEEAQVKAQNTYSEGHAQVARELAELEETLLKFKDRVTRLSIVSPFNGIVQQLVPRASGEVIKPGDVVANIVPLDEEMVIQTQILPADIAQVKVGDPVKIKVSAYDSNIFGTLNGKVQKISASTLQTQDNAPFYKAHIHLEQKHFERNGIKHFILPGMEVQAEIITGAKSLMKYIFKPIYNSLDRAFVER